MGSLTGGEDSKELVQAQVHLWNNIFGFVNSMSLKCAVELGIPEAVHGHGKPITLSKLAAAIAVPPARFDSLRRLLRLLVQLGLLAVDRDGGGEVEAYVLTAFASHLVEAKGTTLSPFVLMMVDKTVLDPWHVLSEWFKGGEAQTSFELAYGTSVWEVAHQRPEFNKLVNEAMASEARFTTELIMRECGDDVFGGLKSLVDVGGGTGTVAMAIAAAFPHVKCSVFDLPHVVASVPKNAGIGVVGGNMFEHVPPANAVLLKKVLHDWSDEDCVKILKRCKDAIPSKGEGGVVIIIEMVVSTDEGGDPEVTMAQLASDVVMMAQTTGKEREEHEWKKMFDDAGFASYEIKRAMGLQSLIAVYP